MADKRTNDLEMIQLDGENLSLEQIIKAARKNSDGEYAVVQLTQQAREKMTTSRALVERWTRDGKPHYGINTGFGANQGKRIRAEEIEELQQKLILSHAVGVGCALPEEVVRAMMVLRANALAGGYSGIRVEVVERLLEMLNKEVCPVVPAKGSVGSSGDLAPLAHMTLVMLDIPGHACGEAFYDGQRMSGAEAMRCAAIEPIKLQAKEGIALTNGTQMMTAIGSLAIHDALNLAKVADIAGAMSLEALKGKSRPFMEEVQQLRRFKGQAACARNIRDLIAGSELKDRHDEDTAGEVQDAYSLRCMPQVHGATREALTFVRDTLLVEINSVTDNPLIFPELSDPVEAGNFHGQPVALALDFLTLALAELGNISERRTTYMLDERRNRGLPAFLVKRAGLNSGMMMMQYTAAALVSENKVLIHPASGDSIPTSANQEDHNSMGSIAARQAREVLENVEQTLAIELLCAAQALEFREQKRGVGTAAAHAFIRQHVAPLNEDRELYIDMQKMRSLVHEGELVREVERALTKRESGLLE